jgi:hypothetical protein
VSLEDIVREEKRKEIDFCLNTFVKKRKDCCLESCFASISSNLMEKKEDVIDIDPVDYHSMHKHATVKHLENSY